MTDAPTSRPTSRPTPLATAVVAALPVAILLSLGELLLSGFAPLSGGGSAASFLLVQLGIYLALALGYGLAIAAFLGGLRRTVDLAAGWRGLSQRVRSDADADVRLTATLVALGVSLLVVVVGFIVVYAGKDPEFLAKPRSAGPFFAFFVFVLMIVAAAAFFPLHVAIRWLVRLTRADHWMRSERFPLALRTTVGVVGLGALLAGLILVRMLGNYEMANVLRFPLFLLVFVILHAAMMVVVCRLRGMLGAWLGRTGVAVTAVVSIALIAVPMFGLASMPEVRDSMEQNAFYEASVASLLRAVFDLDRDGEAWVLDGGDCNDLDASVHADAKEIPGDGVDNDCDGEVDEELRSADEWALPDELASAASEPKPTQPTPTVETPKAPESKRVETHEAPEPKSVETRKAPEPEPAAPKTAEPPPKPTELDRAALAADHLFIILTDTVRADHVHYYGYERETTPNIDALARESVVFRNAYAQANHTPRSMPSIFTGLFPSEIKWDRLYRNFSPIKKSNVTLWEILSKHGFTTLGVFAHWYFEKERRMDQGFTIYDNRGAKSLAEGNTLSPAPLVTKKALAHIRKIVSKGGRVAAFIHYMDPHSRYMKHSRMKAFDHNKTLMDKYDGELYWTDHYVGELIAGLKELGIYDKSVIVVIADHGEAFKDHKSYFHGMTLYREEVQVPLILRIPGVKHRDVDERVALVDVFPTALDLFGIPYEGKLQGVSLVKTGIEGEPRGKPVYTELCKYPNWKEDIRALYVGDLKIIWNKTKNHWELFDLATDPLEQHNVFHTHPKAQAMKKALLDWMETQVGGA